MSGNSNDFLSIFVSFTFFSHENVLLCNHEQFGYCALNVFLM